MKLVTKYWLSSRWTFGSGNSVLPLSELPSLSISFLFLYNTYNCELSFSISSQPASQFCLLLLFKSFSSSIIFYPKGPQLFPWNIRKYINDPLNVKYSRARDTGNKLHSKGDYSVNVEAMNNWKSVPKLSNSYAC